MTLQRMTALPLTPMSRRLLIVVLILTAFGCRGRAKLNEPPRKKLPPVPAKKDVALDPALRQRARQMLQQAATSEDAVIRAHAIESLKRTLKSDAKETVLQAMKDPSPRVRFAAAMAAGELQLAEAHDPALTLADDPNSAVAIAARFALHMTGDTSLSHDLEETARSPEPAVRANTAMVLGLMNEPSAVKILEPMLYDREAIVRYQAAESLWRLGNRAGLEMLLGGIYSSYPDDQMMCLLALAAPRKPAMLAHVRPGLTTDYDEVNLVGARAMGMLGSDEGFGWAVKAVRSGEPRMRLLAALAFGAIGRADAQPYLSPLLNDSDPHVRLAAAEAILQLHGAQS